MEISQIAILLGCLAFLAHIIKGLTGFGPAIVFVSIGSVIHNPLEVIVLASLLDIIGGVYLTLLNPEFFKNKKYWIPIGGLMVVGAIIGSITLSVVPATIFEYILGGAIVIISFWFLFGQSEPSDSNHSDSVTPTDGFVGAFSGFCGGFTGMGGPPLIAYLGDKFNKELFRAIIVPIFLVAAIARFSSYGVLGMIAISDIFIYILPPLGTILGNHVGNHFFDQVEQKWFTILIGIILFLSGLRLLVM